MRIQRRLERKYNFNWEFKSTWFVSGWVRTGRAPPRESGSKCRDGDPVSVGWEITTDPCTECLECKSYINLSTSHVREH